MNNDDETRDDMSTITDLDNQSCTHVTTTEDGEARCAIPLSDHPAGSPHLQPRACPVCGHPVESVVQHYARIGEWFDPLKDGMQGGKTVIGHATVYPCQCNVAPGSGPGEAGS